MSFIAQRVSRTQTICLSALPERVFPLFEPIGEKAWAEGWEPQMLFPASGVAEPGTVFTTRNSEGNESIWTMSVYDPVNFHLAYLRTTPGSLVGQIDIHCQEESDGTTGASVTYTFTALSEDGNEFTARFTEAHYQAMMADWERAINHYLAHGQVLPHH